jgi:hypothetical protein
MKRTLLIAVLLVSSHQLFAFSWQGNWRWHKDDGSEATATWLAAENTPITISTTTDQLRLRISLYNNRQKNQNGDDTGGLLDSARLEDSSNIPGAKWTWVNKDAGSNAFMIAGSNSHVSDLEATTKQTSGHIPVYTFKPGYVLVSSDVIPKPFSIAKNQETEFEFCIKATSNIQTAVTYYFRVAAAEYPTGQPLPSLTTAAVLPIHLENFKVQPDNNHAKVMWTTTSELNNDRFEVERSADATNWKTIATIRGNGTSTIAHNYNAMDVNPAKGVNYYRIKQYDVNGKANVSEIRSLKMLAGNVLISVFPNPAKRNISFSVQNNLTDVAVTLTSNSGRLVHRETIQNILANTNYSLKPNQQPAPGVYILHLEAKGFSESIKVVVE